jgi:CBS domain-containing protein
MTTEVLTFSPDETVSDAMAALVDQGIDGAPVVSGHEVVGMLSTSDLIVQESKLHFPTVISILGATLELPGAKRQFDDDLRRTLGGTVGEVMEADPIIVGIDDTVEHAATLLHEHDVSRLPVVDDGAMVGIVSRADIIREILRDDAGG